MKVLLFFMILLSVSIAIPINGGDKGWFSLFGAEFTDAIYLIKTGTMEIDRLIIWIILLIVHVSVICLPFSIKKHSFKEQLIISPLLFVLFYATWNLIVVFLLIPFIIMWLICLSVYFNTRVAT